MKNRFRLLEPWEREYELDPLHDVNVGNPYDDPIDDFVKGINNRQAAPEDQATVRALSRKGETWASDDDAPEWESGEVPVDEEVPPPEQREVPKINGVVSESEEHTEEHGGPSVAHDPNRTYHDVSGRVSNAGPGTGARPDPFGREDEPRVSREELMKRAAVAYDQGSDNGSRYWEDEFTRGRDPLSDQEIRRRAAMMSMFVGPREVQAWAERESENSRYYDQGVERARSKDYQGRRISKGLAQAMVAARQVDPATAATLTHGDEIVKAFVNGGYAQASRFENIEQRYQTHMTDTDRKIAELESRERTAAENRKSQEEIAKTYASRPKSGGAEKVSPTGVQAAIARTLYESARFAGKISKEQAEAAAAGNFGEVPDDIRDNVALVVNSLREMDDKASVRGLTTAVSGEQAKVPTREDSAVNKERRTIQLKPGQIKENEAITLLAQKVRAAAESWRKMDDSARGAYVQYGRAIPEAERSRRLGKYQAEATQLEALTAQIRRDMLGLAQTVPELNSLAMRMGITAETWDPFKGSKAFEEAMRGILQEARTRKRLLNGLSKEE
jgi:hypothetical protein